MENYTHRRVEEVAIREVTDDSVSYEGGTGHGMFDALKGKVKAGDTVLLETRGFSLITGIADADGVWFFRKSDEDLDREHAEFVADSKRRREEEWQKHKDDWAARTAQLPAWLRSRIEGFQKTGGHHFETDGWGYELTICELAVLYSASNGEDTDEIMDFARKHGTSGNQHDFAKAIAKVHAEDPTFDAGGTVSALSPLTGDGDYSKGN